MSRGYLLDTCAWLDAFIAPQLLRKKIHALIHQQPMLSLADITLLEVARKAETGDLILDATLERWFAIALPAQRTRILPITPQIAIESADCRRLFTKTRPTG